MYEENNLDPVNCSLSSFLRPSNLLIYFILSNSLVRRTSSVQGAGSSFLADGVPHDVTIELIDLCNNHSVEVIEIKNRDSERIKTVI